MTDFANKINQEIHQSLETEFVQHTDNQQRSESDIQRLKLLMHQAKTIFNNVKIRVPTLSANETNINRKKLHDAMEKSMVLNSKILDDLFELRNALDNINVVLNGVVGILYHNLKFKNRLKLKTTKELDTYVAQERSYNTVNLYCSQIKNSIDRSKGYSSNVKQKIGFIRDLMQSRTQEMYYKHED